MGIDVGVDSVSVATKRCPAPGSGGTETGDGRLSSPSTDIVHLFGRRNGRYRIKYRISQVIRIENKRISS
jgi:hypothetical protein